MSLLKFSDLNILSDEEIKASSVSIESTIETVIGSKRKTLDQVVGKLKKNVTLHYSTGAEWSMVDLLVYLLEQTGPANVLLSTFEISEFPARIIQQLLEAGKIKMLQCLLDYRAKERKPGVFQLVNNIAVQLKSVPCHAKVTVIMGDDISIAVISSANYTRNIRIEAGVITTNAEAIEFHKRWMLQELNNKNPFDASE